ncbi:MAG: restriction endonuclease subunit S, partial [Candidatus Pacearchaeota archaeon]|nr:restriction endonuclease subunit S [Candidatus Pacearchaeota archaeon]
QILSIKFILPPTSIQNSIVQILEKAETLKQKREDADKLTKEYLQSVFYEMFGDPVRNEKKWKYIETQELFDMKLGKMLSARNYTGKNLRPYLRNINVQWGHLDLSDVNEMDFDEDEYIKYQLKKGDILVCEGGEVGRTAIYNGEINNCCYQNALHRLRIKDKKINPTYFIYFMEIAVKLGLIKKDTIQVTIAHFTQDKFKRFEIPLPPLPLQHKFASIVEEVEKLKEKQKQSKEELKVMFDSLMKQAFNGELVK